MARLDRMEGDREMAQLAAALGREFSYELLVPPPRWTSRRSRPSWPSWCRPRSCIRRAAPPDAATSSSTPSWRTRCTTRWSRRSGSSSTGGSPKSWRRGPADRRDAARAARPPLHGGGPDRKGDPLLAQGGPAVAGTLRGGRSDRSPESGPGAARDPARSPLSGTGRSWSCWARWAPPTSPRAVTPRPKSVPFFAGRASCASGSGTTGALVRAHAGHLGVAHRSRRPPAVRGPGRRGDGIRRAAQRPRHHDGSVVHGGRDDALSRGLRRGPRPLRDGRSRVRRPGAHPVSGPPRRATTPASPTAATWRCRCGIWATRTRPEGSTSRCANWPARSATRSAWPTPCTTPAGCTSFAGSEPRCGRPPRKRSQSRPNRDSPSGTRRARFSRAPGCSWKANRHRRFPSFGRVTMPSGPAAPTHRSVPAQHAGRGPTPSPPVRGGAAGAGRGAGRRRRERRAMPGGRAAPPPGRALARRVARTGPRRRGLLPPRYRNRETPAKQGLGTAGRHESRPPLADAGSPRRRPGGPRDRLRNVLGGFHHPGPHGRGRFARGAGLAPGRARFGYGSSQG